MVLPKRRSFVCRLCNFEFVFSEPEMPGILIKRLKLTNYYCQIAAQQTQAARPPF